MDPRALFGAPTRKICVGGRRIPSHLQYCAVGTDVLLLWLDCDREGENICYEVMHNVIPWMRMPPKGMQSVYRAKFSSLAPADLRMALRDCLGPPDIHKALAVDARQELDLKLGSAFTRFQTLYFQGKYGHLNSRMLSYGPCLTPTLGFCVARWDEIQSFESEKYWCVNVSVEIPVDGGMLREQQALRTEKLKEKERRQKQWKEEARLRGGHNASHNEAPEVDTSDKYSDDDYDGDVNDAWMDLPDPNEGMLTNPLLMDQAEAKVNLVTKLHWKRDRVFIEDVGRAFHGVCSRATHAVVTDVKATKQRKVRPMALNTVELLKAATRGLGMSPHETMHVAESLYLSGLISYPRTETTDYAKGFDIRGTLSQHTTHPDWGYIARDILQKHKEGQGQRPRRGEDAGDHPPITPTRCATRADLHGNSWRVYELVTRWFLGSVATDCEYELTSVTLSVGDEPLAEYFTTSSQNTIDPGFTLAMPWLAPNDSARLLVELGDKVRIISCQLSQHDTQPPGLLTEAELISLMEEHGIGTDASIPMHIRNIVGRGFARVGPRRTLEPLPLGVALIHGYNTVDPELWLPTMRARVEKMLDKISTGEADYRAVVVHALRIFRAKFMYFLKNIAAMDALMQARFAVLPKGDGEPFSRCGQCQR